MNSINYKNNTMRNLLRINTILLLLINFHPGVTAQTKTARAEIGFNNASLEQVIKHVEANYKVRCTYDPAVTAMNKRIDLESKRRTLD